MVGWSGKWWTWSPLFFWQCKDLENIWYSITPLRCGDNVFTAKHVACVDEDWSPYQLHLAFKYDERPNVPLRVGKLIKRYFGAIPTQPLPVQLGGAAARCRQWIIRDSLLVLPGPHCLQLASTQPPSPPPAPPPPPTTQKYKNSYISLPFHLSFCFFFRFVESRSGGRILFHDYETRECHIWYLWTHRIIFFAHDGPFRQFIILYFFICVFVQSRF